MSPYPGPLVAIPTKLVGVWITINYQQPDKTISLRQLPFHWVGHNLGSLRKGHITLFYNLASSFHRYTEHQETIPRAAFWEATRLSECLLIPQGSSDCPGCFVKVITLTIKGLEQVFSYLDDVILFFQPIPLLMWPLFTRLSDDGASIISSFRLLRQT